MVENFGKESIKSELEPYKYKNEITIPLLGMVDDILIISDSGYKSQRLNGYINAKTAIKRLQFGPDKCHIMHIGKNIPEHKKMKFYVDGWEMKEIDNKLTGNKETQETFNGEEGIMKVKPSSMLAR